VRTGLLTLARQSAVYGLSGAFMQVVGLVTLPVYARALSPAEYGIVEIGTVGFTGLIVAVDAGLGFAMQRFFFEVPEDRQEERRLLVSTATFGTTAIALAIAAVVVLAREPVAAAVFRSGEHADFVALVALAVPLGTLAIFLRDVMRLRFRPWHYTVSAGLASVVAAAVGVIWVLAFDGGVTAIAAGLLTGQAAAAAYGLLVCRRELAPRLSHKHAHALLRLGLPLVPAGAAMWGMSFADRVLLSQLDGFGATGEYAVGTRFSSVLLFFTGAFATAYTPFLFSLYESDPERERQLRARLLTYVSAIFVGIGLCLALFAHEIATVIAPGYDRAYQVVGILCIGAAAFGITPVAGAGISLAKRTDLALKYTTLVLALNVVLCFALIPWLGLVGAATANATGFVTLSVLYVRRSQRFAAIHLDVGRLLGIVVLGGLLMPLGWLQLPSTAATLAVKAAAAAIFILGLRTLRILGDDETAELRRAFARVRRRPATAR
jgi:O-antigen/teichoic acid export membrane protein